MVQAFTLLLLFQLLGEALGRGFGLIVPGPVIGMALFALVLALVPRVREVATPTSTGLLRHLSLLFVPAAVGIIQQLPRLRSEGLAIGVAVVVSTWVALAATALTFRAVAAWLRVESEP